MKRLLSLPLYSQTLVALALGAVVGMVWGPYLGGLAVASKVVIQLIQVFATPLLFFAVLETTLGGQFHGRGIATLLVVCGINAAFAIVIGFAICGIFSPGKSLSGIVAAGQSVQKEWDWTQGLKNYVPDSLLGPFTSNAIPAVILLAIFMGLALRSLEKESKEPSETALFAHLRSLSQLLLKMNIRIIQWVVHLVPFAVFGVVVKVMGEHGADLLHGLTVYVLATVGGMAVQILIVYQVWIRFIGGMSLKSFWKEAKEPAVYSFGVNSSLATMPITLSALDRLKISPASARLSACVGTNLNNDGILLYEVVAALLIAQAAGISLTLFQQLGVAVICVIATLGVAGIPEAGIISLILVLGTLGLPKEMLPILLTVDWFVARCRSVTNVLSDMTVAIAIERFSRK